MPTPMLSRVFRFQAWSPATSAVQSSSGTKLPGAGEIQPLQAADHQHGYDGIGEHPAQIGNHRGGLPFFAENQKGQKPGEHGHGHKLHGPRIDEHAHSHSPPDAQAILQGQNAKAQKYIPGHHRDHVPKSGAEKPGIHEKTSDRKEQWNAVRYKDTERKCPLPQQKASVRKAN